MYSYIHIYSNIHSLQIGTGNDGLAYGLHRWMILGPMHSGSNLHVDPLGTSAWNMLLLGRKLWVLFPPGTYARTYTCTCIHILVHTHAHAYIYSYIHMHTHTYTRTYTCTCIHIV